MLHLLCVWGEGRCENGQTKKRKKKNLMRESACFLRHGLTIFWLLMDTELCISNKIFISGFKPVIPLSLHLRLLGLWGSVSQLLYFKQCSVSLGPHWKGNRGPLETVGTCAAYEIIQRNNGNQTPTGLPIPSIPPANKTVHQGNMFVQILIMYHRLETIFICSSPIHQGMLLCHCCIISLFISECT